MIMHLSIRSDNDQSSRRRFKAIGITMLEEHVESYCSFVYYGKYLYQKGNRAQRRADNMLPGVGALDSREVLKELCR